ncbi:MAG TPA: sensor histidine kinase [Chitinophagaceae bacterium]|nr:sensor histidine kinase [Chitinophagaceae bacterium]
MKISSRIWKILMEEWWVRHLCFWIFIIFFFAWGSGLRDRPLEKALIAGSGYLPGGFIVVYPFLYYLVPKFLYSKKFLTLAITFLGLVLCAKLVSEFMVSIAPRKTFGSIAIKTGRNLLPFVMITAMAATAKLIKYYFYRQQRADKEQEQRIQTELELLKAQIHPNFLFNTLNNLFTHTIKNSSESPNIVLKLSDLLRFMIYESRCEFIPLDHEVQLLNNYIELEKLRHNPDLDISFVSTGELENKMIRPLLLLPLVEYAFQKATSDANDLKWVSINIHSEKNKLAFNLAFSEKAIELSDDATRRAFDNVVKRLELLYAKDHSITITSHLDIGNVVLELSLTDAITMPQNVTLIRNRSYEMEMPVGG